MGNITNLNIADNNFTQLRTISLEGNYLTSLPDEIGNLHNLELFWLSNNQLTTLPSTVNGWNSITSLYLGNNQIQVLPDEIADITTLRTLHLHDNSGYLPNLTSMWSHDNSDTFTRSQTSATPTGKTLTIQ